MWEALKMPSHGEKTVRSILNYVLATIVAALLWVIFTAPATYAADASWNGSSITYQGNTYIGPANGSTLEELNLLDGTTAYTHVDPAPTGTGTSTSGSSRYIHVIYFAPGVDTSTATGAKYKTYIYQGPSSFSNPSNPIDISTEPPTASSTASSSSCDIENGLGWIICPITNTLASGMDWIFDMLSGFLAVRPTETGNDSALFRAWSFMRSFANVAFVIAFLIIIYSQLTSIGLTNYSLKKLLPRLIIAAVLVNVSYYICSIAIDISNILGYSLQDVFIQIRNSLVGTGGNSWDLMSWESLSGFILSGGTAAAAGGIALFTTLSTYGLAGSIILLLPALVIGLTGVLVALLIMAARQAIITLLVILAPLAFVAYLLPNTEKWFEKWRSTFMTMLILFPAFSVVFGGSQLAATAIIQNADSINLVILGMLVQVAPLLITPLLIKLSGSLLGRIAGLINNPNKGIVDRTKNWSKDRADNVKAKRLGTPAGRGALLKRNAQRVDHNRRRREGLRKNHEMAADNRWMGSQDNEVLHEAGHELETEKKTIEERLSRDLNFKIQVTPEMLRKDMEMRVMADQSSLEKAKLDRIHEGMRAGVDPSGVRGIGGVLSDLTSRSELATRDLALTSIASNNAKRVQQNRLADSLLRNTERVDGEFVRSYAGGVDFDNGTDSALAFAVTQKRKATTDLINERNQLIKQFKLNGEQRQDLAMGASNVVGNYELDGVNYQYAFDPNDKYARDAAIDMQLSTGSFDNIMEIISHSGSTLVDYRDTISEGIPSKQLPNKAGFLGGVFIDRVLRGQVTDDAAVRQFAINDYILKGKVKPETLAGNDAGAIKIIREAIQSTPRTPALNAKVAELRNTIDLIMDPDSELFQSTTDASRVEFNDLRNYLNQNP